MSSAEKQALAEQRIKAITDILLRKYGALINDADVEKIIGTRFFAHAQHLFFFSGELRVITTTDVARYIGLSKTRSTRFYLHFVEHKDLPLSYENARHAGVPLYMPTRPCMHGHLHPRSTWTRHCMSCHPLKLAERMRTKEHA